MSKEKPLFLLNLNDLKQLFHENGYSRAKVDLNLERIFKAKIVEMNATNLNVFVQVWYLYYMNNNNMNNNIYNDNINST